MINTGSLMKWHGRPGHELHGRLARAGQTLQGQALGAPNGDGPATCLTGRQAHGQVLGTPYGDAHATAGRRPLRCGQGERL